MTIKSQALLSLLIFITGLFSLQAQVFNPVEWSSDTKDLGDNIYELHFKAKVEEGWHIYSQHIEGDEGPIPTEFSVIGEGIELIEGVKEPKGIEGFDKTFEMNIKYFEDKATFTQKIKLNDNYKDPVKATVLFMVCDDERCLPPEEHEFTFNLKKKR